MSEYGFCQMNDYQDFGQNVYHLSAVKWALGGALCRSPTVLVILCLHNVDTLNICMKEFGLEGSYNYRNSGYMTCKAKISYIFYVYCSYFAL